MAFSFKAKIYMVGINPCVKVPAKIYNQLKTTRGYIPVKGTINEHPFTQTLCPVKNEGYRLYVNGLMLKGASLIVGDTASFLIEQDDTDRSKQYILSADFRKKLQQHKLLDAFNKLAPSRQKEIIRYLDHLKTEAARQKNIGRIINAMKGTTTSPLVRVKK
jgi:hypothetical protein